MPTAEPLHSWAITLRHLGACRYYLPENLPSVEAVACEREMTHFLMATKNVSVGVIAGKLFVFSAAYEAGDWWLVLFGVAATAVSLAYYLNVVRWMYMRSGAELRLAPAGGSPPRDSALGVAIGAAVLVTVGSFFAVQPILDAAADAAASLPF